ncbi:hypothetical protein ACVWW5_003801 [Bradyrhizobium sp. LM3.4]
MAGPDHVLARTAPEEHAILGQQQMMVRCGQINLAGLYLHAVFGLPDRKRARAAGHCRENADALRGDVQNDEHRRGQIGRQAAQDLLQRCGRAGRATYDDDVAVAHGTHFLL